MCIQLYICVYNIYMCNIYICHTYMYIYTHLHMGQVVFVGKKCWSIAIAATFTGALFVVFQWLSFTCEVEAASNYPRSLSSMCLYGTRRNRQEMQSFRATTICRLSNQCKLCPSHTPQVLLTWFLSFPLSPFGRLTNTSPKSDVQIFNSKRSPKSGVRRTRHLPNR